MPLRPPAGFISAFYDPLKNPNAPTIGTATGGDTSASVTFTAPSNVGGSAITGYIAVATPGGASGTGSSSPITVSGLTNGNVYTLAVAAVNSFGPSAYSAASNSVTPAVPVIGQQAYTTAGTYTWVAPAGVTSVSVVCVGGGARSSGASAGSLRYKNNLSVTPGASYTVEVGAGVESGNGGNSYFNTVTTVLARGGGQTTTQYGDGGGDSGTATGNGGGAGAGGYSGNGGDGGGSSSAGTAGAGGGGGGGGTFGVIGGCCAWGGGGGGGVGILGQGSNGAGGSRAGSSAAGGGGGSGGTAGIASNASPKGSGGSYGGGAANGSGGYGGVAFGGGGAVRIIWPGTTRSFPSTNTGNL